MSTPNEPDGQRTGTSPGESPSTNTGATNTGATNGRADATAGAGRTDARPTSGTGPGGMPPWQRVGSQVPPTAPGVTANSPTGGPAPQGDQSRQYPGATPQGAPRRPLVTGSAAAKFASADASSAATTRAPINKLDQNGKVPAGQDTPAENNSDRGRNSLAGKVIDGPTRNIDRNHLPEDLPDLDAIHHPAATAAGAQGANRSVESVAAGPRGPLRAAVQLRRIDPWSTFKISSVLAIALFLIWMIAIGVLYVILDGMGVWDQVNSSFGTLVSSDATTDSSFQITAGGVFGIAALVGAVYVVVFTALTTVGSFIYNMSADLVGGVEVTLADRD